MGVQNSLQLNCSRITLFWASSLSCFFDLEVDTKLILLVFSFCLGNNHEFVKTLDKLLFRDNCTLHPRMSNDISHSRPRSWLLLQQMMNKGLKIFSKTEFGVSIPELTWVPTHQTSILWVSSIRSLEGVVQRAHRKKHDTKGKDVNVLALVRLFTAILLGNNLRSHVNA